MSTALTSIIAVIGSTALSQLIQFFVSRHDSKKRIPEKLETLEKDTIRTQLLFLIQLTPEEIQEILTVAKHYFGVLNGDWYMTSIFNKWLVRNKIAEPEWFDKEK